MNSENALAEMMQNIVERLERIEERLDELADLQVERDAPSYDPPEDPLMELGFSDERDWEAGL